MNTAKRLVPYVAGAAINPIPNILARPAGSPPPPKNNDNVCSETPDIGWGPSPWLVTPAFTTVQVTVTWGNGGDEYLDCRCEFAGFTAGWDLANDGGSILSWSSGNDESGGGYESFLINRQLAINNGLVNILDDLEIGIGAGYYFPYRDARATDVTCTVITDDGRTISFALDGTQYAPVQNVTNTITVPVLGPISVS